MKKGISPVVATALLLVVAVVAVVSFNTWFSAYESKTLTGVEQQGSGSGIPQVDSVIGSSLYINNPSTTSLNVTSVNIAGKPCANSATLASKGITPINISSCVTNLTSGQVYDAVIVTNQGTYSKKFYNKGVSSSLASISVINITPVLARRINATDYGNGIASDSSGNMYVIGTYTGATIGTLAPGVILPVANAGSQDVFITKYNSTGTAQWVKVINSTGSDNGFGIGTDGSGNVYVTGIYYNGPVNLGSGVILPAANGGGPDIFLIKYSSAGVPQWKNVINSTAFDYGYALTVDSIGNSYISGFYRNGPINLGNGVILSASASGSADAYLVKYNSAGIPQWVSKINSTGSDLSRSVAVDSSNNVYISGFYSNGPVTLAPGVVLPVATNSDGYVIKYNSTGGALWAKRVNSSNTVTSKVTVDSSGNVIVEGYYTGAITIAPGVTLPASTSGSQDVFIVKYDALGTAQWARRVNSTAYDESYHIAVDSSNNIYVCGRYDTSSITLAPGIVLPAPASGTGGFFIKYDPSGTVQWAKKLGSTGGDIIQGISIDNSLNFYITGYYRSSLITLAPGVTLPTTPLTNAFIVKYH